MQYLSLSQIKEEARRISDEIEEMPERNAPHLNRLRKQISRRIKTWPGKDVIQLGLVILEEHGHRGMANELIFYHPQAVAALNVELVERLGKGIDSWFTTDSFGVNISGPAWIQGRLTDEDIAGWAGSDDRWWRRAALVSTVPLNTKSRGGQGDARRTLSVCQILVDDRDDMVVKAMSWALRDLIGFDRKAVETFLANHEDRLAARVKREVRNKLETGLKNPRRKQSAMRNPKND
jgi:3-methyladenine DNA glycosylase AlkD